MCKVAHNGPDKFIKNMRNEESYSLENWHRNRLNWRRARKFSDKGAHEDIKKRSTIESKIH